ncbi:acyltransferase family protein [Undibacterium terreum]|uniref:Acyltransferase n=1 Tax=Undibacterium terreum TaxID=1224302 RepID=A0A916XH05_9BURK|nr:acyltransferase [Undibacterium terreum]GGC69852.1 acyltransferase [Undibacterium terreum]
MKQAHASRLNGLDTLRAIAILLVLMYHYMKFVSSNANFGVLSEIGWAGVDLFFVLSGYLIGNQIFSALKSGQQLSLKLFYIRRFLRTLPNYYVVLALYFIFPLAMGGNPVTPLWKFLTFTQNLGLKSGSAFSQAWSLCIEEQFYLILPVLALLFARFRLSMRSAWGLLIATMLAGMAIRAYFWTLYANDVRSYYTHVYYASFSRFDELLPGVALAMLKNFHEPIWKGLLEKYRLSMAAGLAVLAIAFGLFLEYNYIEGQGYTFVTGTFGYTLLSVGFAFLCLSALSPCSLLHRIRVPGAASLALWSYALYLVHKPLMHMLQAPLQEQGISVNSATGIAIMMLASVFAGWLLYMLVETPFMNLRDRFYSSNSRSSRSAEVESLASSIAG